jgi:hypothetical protein
MPHTPWRSACPPRCPPEVATAPARRRGDSQVVLGCAPADLTPAALRVGSVPRRGALARFLPVRKTTLAHDGGPRNGRRNSIYPGWTISRDSRWEPQFLSRCREIVTHRNHSSVTPLERESSTPHSGLRNLPPFRPFGRAERQWSAVPSRATVAHSRRSHQIGIESSTQSRCPGGTDTRL